MVEMGIEYINITIIWVIDKVLDTSGGGVDMTSTQAYLPLVKEWWDGCIGSLKTVSLT